MNISDIPKILSASMITGDNICLVGDHGIGKTEIIENWAKDNNVHCETLILSLVEIGDLAGIPYLDNNSTNFAEPMWLTRMKRANEQGKRCILFVDEINRAAKDVLSASLSLVLSRRINEHYLPELNGIKTLVVAAMNPDNSDHNYQVDTLDIALISRFCWLNVEIDVPSWLEWARKNKINAIVRDFISNNTQKLHFTPKDSIGCTPRSWSMLSKYIDIKDTIDPSVLFNIIEGKVGTAVGAQFMQFLQNYIDVVKVKDIEDFLYGYDVIDGDTIKKISEDLNNELLHKIEPVSAMELCNQLWEKYMVKPTSTTEILPLLVTLYSLNLETRVGYLKNKRLSHQVQYMRLAELDFNKNLFKTAISN